MSYLISFKKSSRSEWKYIYFPWQFPTSNLVLKIADETLLNAFLLIHFRWLFIVFTAGLERRHLGISWLRRTLYSSGSRARLRFGNFTSVSSLFVLVLSPSWLHFTVVFNSRNSMSPQQTEFTVWCQYGYRCFLQQLLNGMECTRTTLRVCMTILVS